MMVVMIPGCVPSKLHSIYVYEVVKFNCLDAFAFWHYFGFIATAASYRSSNIAEASSSSTAAEQQHSTAKQQRAAAAAAQHSKKEQQSSTAQTEQRAAAAAAAQQQSSRVDVASCFNS